ncbi:MAG TPA: DUF2530 domain-containing protein [Propionicimonas sp.]|uniref:DUF2530 domain-containing protein n=1 Tax=Propionicimonas sp. TaxID=1955623 RepID=UPI002F40D68E
MTQNTHHHKPLMVQAPVRALDADGVAVVSAGTVGFAIASVVCWFTRADLEALGKLWYLGVSLTGTALGLLGLAFGLYRKLRRRRNLSGPAAGSIEEALVDTDGVPDRE